MISVLSFIIIQLPPGDFVDAYIAQLSASGSVGVGGGGGGAAQALRARPADLRAVRANGSAASSSGDFGESMEWRRPVTEVIGDRLWLTLLVSFAALILTWGARAADRHLLGGAAVLASATMSSPSSASSASRCRISCWRSSCMYLLFSWFDANVGGLFSAEYELAPWSWAKAWDLLKHLPLPAMILALARHRAAHPHHARQPARRAAPALRRDGARQGPVRDARHPEISRARRAQSVRQQHSPICFPIVVSGSIIVSIVLEPAHGRAAAAHARWSRRTCSSPARSCCCSACSPSIGTFISDLVLMWIDPRIRHQVETDAVLSCACADGSSDAGPPAMPPPRIASPLRASCS